MNDEFPLLFLQPCFSVQVSAGHPALDQLLPVPGQAAALRAAHLVVGVAIVCVAHVAVTIV